MIYERVDAGDMIAKKAGFFCVTLSSRVLLRGVCRARTTIKLRRATQSIESTIVPCIDGGRDICLLRICITKQQKLKRSTLPGGRASLNKGCCSNYGGDPDMVTWHISVARYCVQNATTYLHRVSTSVRTKSL